MIRRISFVVCLLSCGAWAGGWTGVFACFLIAGLVGWIIGPPKATGAPLPSSEPVDDSQAVPARRGRRKDPTRPSETADDFAGMITAYLERNR